MKTAWVDLDDQAQARITPAAAWKTSEDHVFPARVHLYVDLLAVVGVSVAMSAEQARAIGHALVQAADHAEAAEVEQAVSR